LLSSGFTFEEKKARIALSSFVGHQLGYYLFLSYSTYYFFILVTPPLTTLIFYFHFIFRCRYTRYRTSFRVLIFSLKISFALYSLNAIDNMICYLNLSSPFSLAESRRALTVGSLSFPIPYLNISFTLYYSSLLFTLIYFYSSYVSFTLVSCEPLREMCVLESRGRISIYIETVEFSS
jgi:hypothetical protein